MTSKDGRRLGWGGKDSPHSFTVDGITDTLSGWASRLGCTYLTLYKRIRRGMTPADAIHAGADHMWRTYLTINGERHTIAEWGRKVGVSPDTISSRISTYGWTAEEAVGLKPHASRMEKRLTYRGKTCCIAEWARELGISDEAMRMRLRLHREGRLAKSAVFSKGNLNPWRKVRKVKHQNWYRGKRITISEICERKGCGRTLVCSWLKAGYSATQILDNPAIAPCRDAAEISRRQAASQRRNKHLRELKKMGLII